MTITPEKLMENPDAVLWVEPDPQVIDAWLVVREGEALVDGFASEIEAEEWRENIRRWIYNMKRPGEAEEIARMQADAINPDSIRRREEQAGRVSAADANERHVRHDLIREIDKKQFNQGGG